MSHPFFLYEATLALFPSPDGRGLGGGALFWGGPAVRLGMQKTNTGVMMAASGDTNETEHQVNENHQITIDQAWLVREDGAEFTAERGQFYILQILWRSKERTGVYWNQRTYYGVTCQEFNDQSEGTLHSLRQMRFRAQTLVSTGGPGSGPGAYNPITPPNTLQSVLFPREVLLVAGEYLLGIYRWQTNATAVGATAICTASQNAATVLGLELNGTLTGDVITLPAGAVNSQVTVTVSLNRTVPAGTPVRWKIISGPGDIESMAAECAVTMQIKVNN